MLSPRDLVSRPDNMDKTELSSYAKSRFSHDTAHIRSSDPFFMHDNGIDNLNSWTYLFRGMQ